MVNVGHPASVWRGRVGFSVVLGVYESLEAVVVPLGCVLLGHGVVEFLVLLGGGRGLREFALELDFPLVLGDCVF